MFLLVLVFLFVLLFSILPEFIPGISRKAVKLVVQDSEEEADLRQQLKTLCVELKTISMSDEFARYAKSERKINKLKEELSKYTKSKSEVFLKFKFGTNIGFQILQVLCFLSLIWSCRSVPLLSMPEEWFFPFSRIVAFPSGVSGSLGITCWLIVCRNVVQKGLAWAQS